MSLFIIFAAPFLRLSLEQLYHLCPCPVFPEPLCPAPKSEENEQRPLLSLRDRRNNLGVDGPLFLRYGYFMPRPSMIRGDDIQGKIPRFLS